MSSTRPPTGVASGSGSVEAGRFERVRTLGEGALARVDLVRDLRDGSPYALKVVPTRHEDLLRREVRIRGRLAHPQVPAALELMRSGPELADGSERRAVSKLLLEYVHGEPLGQAARSADAESLIRWLGQSLNVLFWLHRRGVVHGDVKPENLCVQEAPEGGADLVRLLDFGTAVDLSAGEGEWQGGTPAYLAPYLKETGVPDPRADLFALGLAFQRAVESARPRIRGQLEDTPLPRFLERLAHPDADLAFPDATAALERLFELYPGFDRDQLPPPRDPAFAGRDELLARFAGEREALETRLLSRGVLLIQGSSGIGRSRLLTELEHETIHTGVDAVRLRCPVRSGALEPILELLSRRIPSDHPGRGALTEAIARFGEGDAFRFTLAQLTELARQVRKEGGRQPLIVFIDDLQNADESTLEFLRLYARLEAPSGPLFVGAVATDGGEANQGLARLTDPGEDTRCWPLSGLSPESVRTLIQSLVGAPLSEESLEEALLLADGNPALAVALARAPATPRGGSEPARSPEDVQARLTEARLARLSPAELELVDDLAVLGRSTPLWILQQVASLPGQELLPRLETLAAHGLVESEIHRNGRRVRLRSEGMGRRRRRAMDGEALAGRHGRAFDAWVAWPFPIERPVDMLVHHAIGARRIQAAVELAHEALESLLATGGLRSVEDLADTLLRTVSDQEVRERALCALAEVALRTGRAARAQELLQGREVFRSPELRRRALRLTAMALEAEGHLEEAQKLLESAHREKAGERDDEQARVAERLGAVLYRGGEHAEARRVWELGLSLLAEDELSLVKSELLNNLGVLDWEEGLFESSTGYHAEALRIRREAGDLDGEARSLTNLANVSVDRGELERATEHYEESLRLKRLVGSPQSQAITLRNLGTTYGYLGEYGKAFGKLGESLRLRERLADRRGAAATRRIIAGLLHQKGEVRRAKATLELASRAFDELEANAAEEASLREVRARFELNEGRPSAAASQADEALKRLRGSSYAGQRARLLRHRALARLEEGDPNRARADLESAGKEARKAGDYWEIAWTRLALGRLLGPTEPELAAEETRATEDMARRLGAPWLLGAALVQRFDLELERVHPDVAAGWVVESERLASRIGVPLAQVAAWYRMGLHARRSGFTRRAVQWWIKALEAILVSAREFDDGESQRRFLTHGDTARVLAALGAALSLSPRPSDSIPDEDTMTSQSRGDAQRSLNELLSRARKFAAEAEASLVGKRRLESAALERLLEVSRAMNGLHHREELFAYLRDRLEELFHAENSKIIVVGRGGSFHLMGESEASSRDEISRTLLERVLAERRPLLIRDATHDPELHDKSSVHKMGLSSVLCAPLIVDGDVLGVIQFEHRSKPGPFTEGDLSILELFAQQAATALKNILLRERLDESIDRMRASEARLVANERLRALGEMSAGVAHDFNNLLTIIVGITDLMRTNADLPASMRADVDTLETVSQTAAGTIRRLQEFRGAVHASEPGSLLDPNRVVRQAVELGRRRFEDGRFEVRLEFQDTPPILGHESEFREVLLNLIINAYEAMPEGGVTTLRTRAEGDTVVVEVEDRGVGIAPGERQRIFEPFYSTKPTGQGMGLAITWGVLQRMEGTIEPLEVEGGGTRFRIRLPAADHAAVGYEVPSLFAQGAASEASVLVVDDDPVVREVVCRMLSSAGFHASSSGDGQEAVELFEQEAFDLVLTDYVMPGKDGVQVAREIKEIRADCPVVLLTGRSPGVEEDRFEPENPFSLVLEKPITTEKLAAALHLGR